MSQGIPIVMAAFLGLTQRKKPEDFRLLCGKLSSSSNWNHAYFCQSPLCARQYRISGYPAFATTGATEVAGYVSVPKRLVLRRIVSGPYRQLVRRCARH